MGIIEVLDRADGGEGAMHAGGKKGHAGLAQLFEGKRVDFAGGAFGVHAGEMQCDEGTHIVGGEIVFGDSQPSDHVSPAGLARTICYRVDHDRDK